MQLSYRVALMEGNQAGRLRELVRYSWKAHHSAELSTSLCRRVFYARSSLFISIACNKLLPELDNGARTGLRDGWYTLWLCLLGCIVQKNHISFYFNSLIELVRDGRACCVLCLNTVSSAGAGCVASPGRTAGTATLLGTATLACPQLGSTDTGRPLRCGVDCACSSWLVWFSVLGWAQPQSTDFSGPLFAGTHVESLLSRGILFYLFKMCCSHRLHLLSRILPKGKHGGGTKPAPQVRFPREMQTGMSVHVVKC